MSSVDERIVEMKFDNNQFESGVKSTLESLEALKKGLNFQNLESGVSALQQRFSTLGIVGMEVTKRLTNAAIDAGKRVLDVTLGQVKSGGMSRALNLEQAEFQLKGILPTAEAVADAMQAAKNAVDGTAYGFDEAAKAASVLAASGVTESSRLEAVLKSIAGAAAMTGRGFSDIADIYSTVASNGKLMTMQLRQFSASGLNVSAVLAKAFNTTEEKINDMVTKGKISFDQFSDAMMEFSDDAQRANETFSGSLANMKAALSRIGELFAGPYVDNMKYIFNAARLGINEIKYALEDLIGQKIKDKMQSFREAIVNALDVLTGEYVDGEYQRGAIWDLVEGLVNIANALETAIMPVKDVFKEMFPNATINNLAKGLSLFKDFSVKIADKLGKQTENLKDGYRGLFTILKSIGNAFKFFIDIIKTATSPFGGIINIIGSFIGATGRAVQGIHNFIANTKAISKIPQGIINIVGNLANKLHDFAVNSKLLKNIPSLFLKIGNGVDNGLLKLKDFLKESKLIQTLPYAFSKLGEMAVKLANGLKSLFESFKETKAFNLLETVFERLKNLLISFFNIDLVSVGDKLGSFGEKVKELFTSFKDTKVFTVLESIFNRIKWVFSGLIDILTSLVTLDFSKVGDKLGAFGEKLKEFFATAKDSTAFQILKAGFDKILDIINSVVNLDLNAVFANTFSFVEFLANGFERLVDFVLHIDLGKLLDSVLAGGVIAAVLKITDAFNTLKDKLFPKDGGGIKENLEGFIDSIKSVSDSVKDKIDTERLKTQATAIIIFAGALYIFSSAVSKLSEIDSADLIKGIVAIAVLMEMMSKSLDKLKKATENTKASDLIKASLALILIASAIKSLTKAVERLSELPWQGLLKGLIGVGALLVGLHFFLENTSFDQISFSKGVGLLLIAESLKVMSKAVEKLGNLNLSQLIKGLAGIAVLLTAIGAFTKFAGDPKHMISTGLGLVMLAAGLVIITSAVKKMGDMKLDNLNNGLMGLAAILIMLAAATNLMPGAKMLAIGAGLVLMSAGIIVIAAALKVLASIGDIKQMGTALLGIIAPLAALGILAEVVNPAKLIATAAGILIFAAAITILTPAMVVFGNLKIAQIGKALAMLAGILLVFGGAAALLTPVIPMMLLLGAAIIVLGAGVTIVAAGLMLMAAAFAALATSAAVGAAALVAALTEIITGVIEMIPAIGSALAEGILSFLATLANSAAQFTDAAVKLGMALLKGIQQIIPQIIETGISLIYALLMAIEAKIDLFVNVGVGIIAKFLLGLSEAADTLIQAGQAMMFNFVITLANAIRTNAELMVMAAKDLMSAFVEAIITVLQELLGSLPVIGDDIKAGLEKAKEGVRDLLDVEEAEQMAADYTASISKGIDENIDKLKQASQGAGEAVAQPTAAGFHQLDNMSKEEMANMANNVEAGKPAVTNAAQGVSEETMAKLRPMLEEAGMTGEQIDAMMAGGMTSNLGAVQAGAEGITNAANAEYDKATGQAAQKAKEQSEAYAQALNPQTAANAAKGIAETVAKNLDQGKKTALLAGKALVTEYGNAIKSNQSVAKSAATTVATQGGSGFGSSSAKFTATTAGQNLGNGFISGINSKATAAYNAGFQLGAKAAQGVKDGEKSSSPSKLGIIAGKFLGDGLVIGINSMNNAAYNAGYDIGNTASNALSDAMLKVYNILNSDLDMSPKITPVLDLSKINHGINQMDNMLNTRRLSASVSNNLSGVGLMPAYAAASTNTVANNTNNTINIRVDGTENPEAFADRLVRQFQLRGRMA